jgi:hypothetical protein
MFMDRYPNAFDELAEQQVPVGSAMIAVADNDGGNYLWISPKPILNNHFNIPLRTCSNF